MTTSVTYGHARMDDEKLTHTIQFKATQGACEDLEIISESTRIPKSEFLREGLAMVLKKYVKIIEVERPNVHVGEE